MNCFTDLSSESIFFLGNGILRVDTCIEQISMETPVTTPSWQDYMNDLYNLVSVQSKDTNILSAGDFMKLSAPRQAEWFDRNFNAKLNPSEIAALRLHLLGIKLHPLEGLLTNDILKRISCLVSLAANKSPEGQIVDLVTSNLDCSLEQNIATAMEAIFLQHEDISAEIVVMSGFRTSTIWQRQSSSSQSGNVRYRIRIWKIHGCLRDLKMNTSSQDWARLQDILRSHQPSSAHCSEFCGYLPSGNQLTPDLAGKWIAKDFPTHRQPNCIFSISEYFQNLTRIAQLRVASALEPEKNDFDMLIGLIKARPLLIMGYSLLEEDVDIVYLLQTFESVQPRSLLIADRFWDSTSEARLNQMGIISKRFSVEPQGFSSNPGQLRLTRRHEWRIGNKVGWTKAIQKVVSKAWLEPQKEWLDKQLELSGSGIVSKPRQSRLVFAGLASIWHAIALQQESDFPSRRRVSAKYTPVDSQVPGGSALVACMEAAVMAGPDDAGHVSFLTNVPTKWSSWNEIEEFCLSAGVDVRPHPFANNDTPTQVGRTSYVLLWNPSGSGTALHPLPKQRYIMDVSSHADSSYSGVIKPPPAIIEANFQAHVDDDLLFIDKEVDFSTLKGWRGAIILETGASGIELLNFPPDARPTLWTGGVGSFLRTFIAMTSSLPAEKEKFPGTLEEVLKCIHAVSMTDPYVELRELLACPKDIQLSFVAKLVSFERPPWREGKEGFGYPEELAYGKWLQENWWSAGIAALTLLNKHNLLGCEYGRIGRGVLTTIHEGGLMGAWNVGGAICLVRILIQRFELEPSTDTQSDRFYHTIVGEGRVFNCEGGSIAPLPFVVESLTARIEISDQIRLRVDSEYCELPLAPHHLWNTLAAGDTVRGALAFGLWSHFYNRQNFCPKNLLHIAFASSTLATLKCYAGSFVNNLSLLDALRPTVTWHKLWGAVCGSV